MAGQTGLIENYDSGSFLTRPDSKTLVTFAGSQYYRKTTMTGCSSGNSQFYYLFFYRDQCISVFITRAATKPVLYFRYDVSKVTTEKQIIKEALIGFTNPQPDKCPMNYKINEIKSG